MGVQEPRSRKRDDQQHGGGDPWPRGGAGFRLRSTQLAETLANRDPRLADIAQTLLHVFSAAAR